MLMRRILSFFTSTSKEAIPPPGKSATTTVGIFCAKSNVFAELEALEQSKAPAHAVFVEMHGALIGIGLPVCHMVAVSQKDSSAANADTHQAEPCLSLYVRNTEAFASLGVRDGNWDGKAPLTETIRSLWINCCIKHGISPIYASPSMFVFFYDLQELRLTSLAHSCKAALIARLMESGNHLKPKHLFVSSQPGVFVVYKNKKALISETNNGHLDMHRKTILQILEESDCHACFNPARIQISFLDAETEASNLYGLSRED